MEKMYFDQINELTKVEKNTVIAIQSSDFISDYVALSSEPNSAEREEEIKGIAKICRDIKQTTGHVIYFQKLKIEEVVYLLNTPLHALAFHKGLV